MSKDDNIVPFDGHISKTKKSLERRGIKPFKPAEKSHGAAKIAGKLTFRQEGFAKSVGYDGLTLSAAYRANYNTEKSADKTVWSHAYNLSNHEDVKERISYWLGKRQASASHNPEKIRAKIVQTLQEMAENEQNRMGDRLKAIELLGKVDYVGIFKERSVVETDTLVDPDQIKQRIADLLKTGTDNS